MKNTLLENIKKLILVITTLFVFFNAQAQVDADRSWSVYKADENSSNYSPLSQINIVNVSQLQPAWTFAMHDKPAGAQPGKVNAILL
jgi:quinoprotein glucose dehydrogenase